MSHSIELGDYSMHTHVSKLTSETGKVYNTAEEWIADHGPCATDHVLVKGSEIKCDGTSTVTRTLVFLSAEDESQVLGSKVIDPSKPNTNSKFVTASDSKKK